MAKQISLSDQWSLPRARRDFHLVVRPHIVTIGYRYRPTGMSGRDPFYAFSTGDTAEKVGDEDLVQWIWEVVGKDARVGLDLDRVIVVKLKDSLISDPHVTGMSDTVLTKSFMVLLLPISIPSRYCNT
jgi:hypothetical protein